MNFCNNCAAPVVHRIPPGDSLPRFVCDACGTIHYENPRVIVGCVAQWEGKVLLCRRAIEPRHGLWTLPAGFLENGESVEQGALRETLEEANARARLTGLFSVYSVPQIHQVHMMFHGELADLDFFPGEESLECALFTEAQIPWEKIAFITVRRTLRHYFEDQPSGHFGLHLGTVERPPQRTDADD